MKKSFGDILGEWENAHSQNGAGGSKKRSNIDENGRQISRKKANAPSKEEKAALSAKKSDEELMEEATKKRIHPLELWLRRHGTVDKDAELDSYNEKVRMESREYIRTMKPEAKIDLHGLTRDEAWSKLESFVAECVRRGLKKILIVHGKGNHNARGSDPVLGKVVQQFIEQNAHLGTSGHPDHTMGGSGATWVILK